MVQWKRLTISLALGTAVSLLGLVGGILFRSWTFLTIGALSLTPSLWIIDHTIKALLLATRSNQALYGRVYYINDAFRGAQIAWAIPLSMLLDTLLAYWLLGKRR